MSEALSRWRWPAVLALAVVAAGVIIALLQPSPSARLDPNDTSPGGGHALADLLQARGQRVIRVSAPPAASANAASGNNAAGNVELITSPDLLTGAQLTQAARFHGDILITDPDPAALRVLAPAVTISATGAGTADGAGGGTVSAVGTAPPLCNVRAANLAGDTVTGGTVLQTSDTSAGTCYPGGGGYGLIRYQTGGRTVTVLGTSAPLANQYLADHGDAALALNLLREADAITWIVPDPSAAPPSQSKRQSFFGIVPWPVYLIAIQLAVAAVLAAAWRARRLGPLVAEKLPVIVRASETVEGHGRLYHARRARDRAAAELRAAARARIAARTGQPPGTLTAPELDGPDPASDTDLVALAADLDELERKVRHP